MKFPHIPFLTEGRLRKGGQNKTTKITERPAAPASMRVAMQNEHLALLPEKSTPKEIGAILEFIGDVNTFVQQSVTVPKEYTKHEYHWLHHHMNGALIVQNFSYGYWNVSPMGGRGVSAEQMYLWGWRYYAPAVPPVPL